MKYLFMNKEEVIEGSSIEEFNKGLADESLIGWLDLDSPKRENLKLLAELFNLHPLLIKDCHKHDEFPKLDFYDNVCLLVLQGISYDGIINHVELSKLCLIIGTNFLITIHYGNFPGIHTSWHNCKKKYEIIGEGIEGVLHRILDDFFDELIPIIATWEDNILMLEDQILVRKNTNILEDIVILRRNIIRVILSVRRQKEVIGQLSRENIAIISGAGELYFKDIKDQIDWIYFNLEVHQHLLDSMFEANFSMLSNQLNEKSNRINKLMQRFTVVTIIFSPLTFLAGVYGMNFKNMPELDWHYGYFAFWGLIAMITFGLYFLFKRKKWLE